MKIIESYMHKLDYYDWMEPPYAPVWRLSIVKDDDDFRVYDRFAVDYNVFGIFLSVFEVKSAIRENYYYTLCCHYLLRSLV